jgi:hypothetical protein
MTEKGKEVEWEGKLTALELSPYVRRAGGPPTNVGGSAPIRIRGTILWFNVAKDIGALRTDDDKRIEVPGTAFLPGEKPVGRCGGKTIEFEVLDGSVASVAFIPEPSRRRARRRRR